MPDSTNFGEINSTDGAWIAAANDKNQWVEVNLYRQMVITGVNMQGNPSSRQVGNKIQS